MGLWSGLGMRPRSIGGKLSVEDLIDGQTNHKQGLSGWWHRCRQSVGNGLCHCIRFRGQQSLAGIQKLHRKE